MIKILITDAEEALTRSVVMCLSSNPEYQIYLLSNDSNNYMKYSRFCKKYYLTDDSGLTVNRLTKICEIIEEVNIDIIFPVHDFAHQFILENLEILQEKSCVVLMPDKNSYSIAINKGYFASFCVRNNICVPRTLSVCEMGVVERLREITFPVLLKPTESFAGRGILSFDKIDECVQYITKNFATIQNKYIIQEYVDGVLMCVNVLCENGNILIHTIQQGISPPRENFGYCECVELKKDDVFLKIVKPIFEKLQWNGLANVDLLYDKENRNIYILEVNPRPWGTILASFHGGVNFPDLLIKKSLSRNFDVFPESYQNAKYIALNKSVLKQIMFGGSPYKLSDTNFRLILSDPLPSIMSKISRN